jgi:hypothetical protein
LAGAFADLLAAGFVAAFFAGALVATFLATGLPRLSSPPPSWHGFLRDRLLRCGLGSGLAGLLGRLGGLAGWFLYCHERMVLDPA